MCGIAGIIRFKEPLHVDSGRIETMMRVMKHRGPDDEGLFRDSSMGLGFVRLSILDLSQAGHQPMSDISGRYTIVYNGEIYNYIELRGELEREGYTFRTHTDTEVLLTSYIHYGESCLNRLNGMFAFMIYDKEQHRFFGARDRFGVKPFYYYHSDSEFIFSSEIEPILSVYGQKNTPNNGVIFDYLAYNRTDQTEDTFFDGIKKLQHGHSIVIEADKVKIAPWYNLVERISTPVKEDIEAYKSIFDDSIRIRLRSDVPVGVCLSGGLDSSAITSTLLKTFHKTDLQTFSAVYGKENRADESEFIDLFRPEIEQMHFITPSAESLYADLNSFVRCHAEPLPSTGPYAQYCVMKLAHESVTVTLDGQGADEELAGYHYFYGLYFKNLFSSFHWAKMLKEMVAYGRLHRSLYGFKSMLFFMLSGGLQQKARTGERGYLCDSFINNYGGKSVIVDRLYASKSMKEGLVNHFEYKLEHLLKWNDRNSMAFSIESRTPFLDYRLVEYTLSLPDSAKIKDGYTKAILREAMKGILPEKIRLRRDKKGFSNPLSEWLRTPLFSAYIQEILNSESFKSRGIIDADKAKVLYNKHLNGEIDIAKDIWKWINLELWFRLYIDNH